MANRMLRLMIILTIVFTVISTVAMADGIDDPRFYEQPEPHEHTRLNRNNDPNYWSNFDKNPCSYPIWPDGFICRTPTRIEYIPNTPDPITVPIHINSVPEPNTEALLVMGLAALLLKTRIRK